jgi:hypothetical protein
MAKLTFLNHASYMIKIESSLLIIDLLVESDAFDNNNMFSTLIYSKKIL